MKLWRSICTDAICQVIIEPYRNWNFCLTMILWIIHVIIAPYRNWNTHRQQLLRSTAGYNWTLSELKWQGRPASVCLAHVIIEPYRNWNACICEPSLLDVNRYNWTLSELKLISDFNSSVACSVIIEPYRNWNIKESIGKGLSYGYNWTLSELK